MPGTAPGCAQHGQCSSWRPGTAGAPSSPSAADDTRRIPFEVQAIAQAALPRFAASACDTVGNSTSDSSASKASQPVRCNRSGLQVNTAPV